MPRYNISISLDANDLPSARKAAQGWDIGNARIESIFGPPEVQHFAEGVPSDTPALAEPTEPLPPNEQPPP